MGVNKRTHGPEFKNPLISADAFALIPTQQLSNVQIVSEISIPANATDYTDYSYS